MKNNKGMTLVEIIISIALISIVLLFLVSLLINVKDINDESEVNSSYLITKSLIIKSIEEDFAKINLDSSLLIKPCLLEGETPPIKQIYSSYNESDKSWVCINFVYPETSETEPKNHLLGIYYYAPKNNYVISYISEVKTTRILDNFDPNNIKYKDSSNNIHSKLNVEFKYDASNTLLNIFIPLVGEDNKDYSLNISYFGTLDGASDFNTSNYYNNL